jgi:hypothetical protein
MHAGILWGFLKVKDSYEDLGVDWSVLLMCVLNK